MRFDGILHLNVEHRSRRHIDIAAFNKIPADQTDRPQNHRAGRRCTQRRRFMFQFFFRFRSQYGGNRFIIDAEYLIELDLQFTVATETARRLHFCHDPRALRALRQHENLIDKYILRDRETNFIALLIGFRRYAFGKRNRENGVRRHFHFAQFKVTVFINAFFQTKHARGKAAAFFLTVYFGFQRADPIG